MEILILVMIFAGIFGVYDAIRKVNDNILKQTEILKNIYEELKKN